MLEAPAGSLRLYEGSCAYFMEGAALPSLGQRLSTAPDDSNVIPYFMTIAFGLRVHGRMLNGEKE